MAAYAARRSREESAVLQLERSGRQDPSPRRLRGPPAGALLLSERRHARLHHRGVRVPRQPAAVQEGEGPTPITRSPSRRQGRETLGQREGQEPRGGRARRRQRAAVRAVMKLRASAVVAIVSVLVGASASADAPRGSITIDRISQIRYPSAPAWSPDGQSIAFLWDAWGKQDLFVVSPGQKPIALTDFTVDPDIRTSDITSFAWVSPAEILFAKDGALWTVSPAAPHPARMPGSLADAANFTLSDDRKLIAFTRGGQVWTASLDQKTQRPVTGLNPLTASNPVFS